MAAVDFAPSADDSPSSSAASAGGHGCAEAAAKVREFLAARDAEATRNFRSVVAAGMCVISAACAVFVVVLIGYSSGAFSKEASMVFGVFAALGFSAGVVLLSTCPLTHVDVNAMLGDRLKLRAGLCLGLVLVSVSEAFTYFPGTHGLGVVYACLLFVGSWLPNCCRIRPTTAISLFLWNIPFSQCVYYARLSATANDRYPAPINAARACVPFLSTVAMLALQCCTRFEFFVQHCSAHADATGATYSFYLTLYLWFMHQGIHSIAAAFVVLWHDSDIAEFFFWLFYGLAFTLPIVLVVAVGSDRLFHVSARHFNRDPERVQRDGAFIAALIDSSPVIVGQVWYVPRPELEKDVRFPDEDTRHHWRRGRVCVLNADTFVVELEEDRWGPRATKRSMPMRASASSAVASWSLQGSAALQGKRKITFPLQAHNVSWDELLVRARRDLRCVDASNVTLELFDSNSPCEEWADIARPTQESESIDFFLSHSWHDSADDKFAALTRTSDSFAQRHGRVPTFWIDKACINQLNIIDGLRVLPVNIAACSRMLVMCGQTYPFRLWCVWEMLTLLALASMDQAVERLQVVPLDPDGPDGGGLGTLQRFNIAAARCYDPNEEARLRHIVRALGGDRFNGRIRKLSKKAARNALSSARGTAMSRSRRILQTVGAGSDSPGGRRPAGCESPGGRRPAGGESPGGRRLEGRTASVETVRLETPSREANTPRDFDQSAMNAALHAVAFSRLSADDVSSASV